MDELTAFQRDLLYVIESMDGPNGLEIKAALEEYYQEEINHGRLYPNLDDLSKVGLIAKSKYDKRTNKYELTHRGKQKIQARIEWEQSHIEDLIRRPLEIEI